MDRDVFQDWLDRVGAAVMAGDYPTYAAAVCLPFTLITETTTTNVEDDETLHAGFAGYRQMLEDNGITHMVRLSSGVTPLGAGLIVGNYTTHLLANSRPVMQPFVSSMTLRQQDGVWRATSIVNSLSSMAWPEARSADNTR
ncbi:hypothetical protein V8J82_19565 [Gymnodinialimonas sp. 2305UL16-5]|uniref:hypothetical protein n=1 Tax=Gymnodinialimonas mytili TaxID=3126503 RepID=UPI003099AF0A